MMELNCTYSAHIPTTICWKKQLFIFFLNLYMVTWKVNIFKIACCHKVLKNVALYIIFPHFRSNIFIHVNPEAVISLYSHEQSKTFCVHSCVSHISVSQYVLWNQPIHILTAFLYICQNFLAYQIHAVLCHSVGVRLCQVFSFQC